MSHLPVRLSVTSDTATQVQLQAEIVGHVKNPYDLWIALQGFDANRVLAGVTYEGINTWQGDTASLTVNKPNGVTFKAYVWLFGDPTTPVSNTVAPT